MEQIGKKDYINEKIPVSKLTILGFQHVLVMYSAAVIVPIILANALQLSNLDLAFLISADLFTCGIATFLQSFGIGRFIGIKLPCREVFARGQKDIKVEGPFPEVENEVVEVHKDYWNK